MLARRAWTRARAAGTSSFPRATREKIARRLHPPAVGHPRGLPLLLQSEKSSSDADIAKAIAYGKQCKLYPLSQAASPPPTTFVDVIDVLYDSTIPYDVRFFQSLDSFSAPRALAGTRQGQVIDSLKSIGIEQGKPFNPEAKTQETLNSAAREAHAWLDLKYEGFFAHPFYEGQPLGRARIARSHRRAGDILRQARRVSHRLPRRLVHFAFFSPKHLGEGQFYLMTIAATGQTVGRREAAYRLHVPANAPVKLYWSGTVYDRARRTRSSARCRSRRARPSRRD